MAAPSSSRPKQCAVQRSISPSTAFASSATSAFSSQSPTFLNRSSSPTRVNLCGAASSSSRSAIRFSSPTNRSFSVPSPPPPAAAKKPIDGGQKRTCLCSPTTHPGSFRCSYHKNLAEGGGGAPAYQLNAKRSAMTNSLVRIGTVDGEWVKRALTALIRPSSHQQRRTEAFRPRPSRLSKMTMAAEEDKPR